MIRTDVLLFTIFVPLSLCLLFLFPPVSEGLVNAGLLRFLLGAGLSAVTVARGYARHSLSGSAVCAALGAGTLIGGVNFIYFVLVIAFYLAGSRATKFGAAVKAAHFAEYREKPQRSAVQVYANIGWLTLIVLLEVAFVRAGEKAPLFTRLNAVVRMHRGTKGLIVKPQDYIATFAHVGALAVVAASAGDTFASELAPVLFPRARPVLITQPWRHVPIGTNGGVTLPGFALSFLGGCYVGLVDYLTIAVLCIGTSTYSSGEGVRFGPGFLLSAVWPVIFCGGLAGLLGSAVDSFLGATCQFSGYKTFDKASGPVNTAEDAYGDGDDDHGAAGERAYASKNSPGSIKYGRKSPPTLGVLRVTDRASPNVHHISGKPLMDNDLVNLLASFAAGAAAPFLTFACLI